MDEHKGKVGIPNKKVKFLKLFLRLWVHVTGIPFQTSIPACCWLHITYIKCRSRTIHLLNEKDQDIRKIDFDRRMLF